MLVYIVEDDPDWQDLYRTILPTHELEIFPDGVTAMQAIDEAVPDAIILDMLLAGPAAPALLAELQSYPDTAQIPIALVTGVTIPADMSDYGVTAVFDKSTVAPQNIINWLCVQKGRS